MANDTTATGEESHFPYIPSQKAAMAAAALFGLSACYHLWQMIKKKTWFYTSLVVGAFMMTLGYGARYIATKNPSSTGPYILQSLFIILPPSLYAATIYMIYGRIVLLVNAPQASIIRPQWVTKIFVTGDVISFLMQAGGGGMQASSNPSSAKLGQKIMLIGLVFQLIFFGFFIVISIVFWRRMRFTPTYITMPTYGKYTWLAMLKLLLAAAAAIIFRCLFRIVEFAQGKGGYLEGKEVFMYLFDAAPMLIVQMSFHFVHAGDVFPVGGIMGKNVGEGSFVELGQRSSV